jgi:hypothetical protein
MRDVHAPPTGRRAAPFGRRGEDGVHYPSEGSAGKNDRNNGYSNYAFRVKLYVDDIQSEAPAVIVWNFKKGAFLRLTEREPRFKAERGFYADSNTACTRTPRQYYGFNVVKLKAVKVAGRTEGGEQCNSVAFTMYYDNRRRVRSIFVLTVYVTQSYGGSFDSLLTMQMQLKDQEHIVGERNLQMLALQNPSERPTMMFTPQLFRNISKPTIGRGFKRAHREMGNDVWRHLGQTTDGDWAHYQQVRTHFTNEYRRHIEVFADFARQAVDVREG